MLLLLFYFGSKHTKDHIASPHLCFREALEVCQVIKTQGSSHLSFRQDRGSHMSLSWGISYLNSPYMRQARNSLLGECTHILAQYFMNFRQFITPCHSSKHCRNLKPLDLEALTVRVSWEAWHPSIKKAIFLYLKPQRGSSRTRSSNSVLPF